MLLVVSARAADDPRIALLMFDYPEADLVNSNSITFVVHAAPALLPPEFKPIWVPITNFNSGHASFGMFLDGTVSNQVQRTVTFPIAVGSGHRFFVVNATNEWGASDFSNAVQIPGVPPGGQNLRLVPMNYRKVHANLSTLTPAQISEALQKANQNRPPMPK